MYVLKTFSDLQLGNIHIRYSILKEKHGRIRKKRRECIENIRGISGFAVNRGFACSQYALGGN